MQFVRVWRLLGGLVMRTRWDDVCSEWQCLLRMGRKCPAKVDGRLAAFITIVSNGLSWPTLLRTTARGPAGDTIYRHRMT
jgi:hypothetical protein